MISTKKKIEIALLFIAIVAIAGCVQNEGQTAAQESAATPVPPPNASVKADQPAVTTIKCELCHTNANDLDPHINGGKLCVNCHGSQVHNIHIGEGTVNLECLSCHGNPPKIPKVQGGAGPGSYSVCEKCHAPPPDSLTASNGHLVLIHLSRAKYCTNCHGTDIGAIHSVALGNADKTSNATT